MAKKPTQGNPFARAYQFKEDAILTFPNAKDADPNEIGAALDKIAAENDGKLSPQQVVERAHVRSHPLHQHFTWNDTAAADKWRLEEARSIIRSIVAVRPDVDGEEQAPVRKWVSADDRNGVRYHSVESVVQSSDLQHAVIRRASRDLLAWENRYQELVDICELVRAARSRLEGRLSGHEDGNPARPS
jgi:hypothetical protein